MATIVVDAGHGGRDPGASGPTGLLEKDANLQYAISLGYYLRKAGHNVIFTRTTDKDFAGTAYSETDDLAGRVAIANAANADLFVAIHMNASSDPAGKGSETYSYPGAVAAGKLSALVQEQLVFFTDTRDRGAKTAHFYVLHHTNMPSILVEVAFISNPDEEKLIADHAFRVKAAVGMFEGIQQYLAQVGKPNA